MSAFGEWTSAHGLPAFRYTMDQDVDPRAVWDPILDPPTRRHAVHLGNRRITLIADNYGRSGLFDEHEGLCWLTRETGVARVGDGRDRALSTACDGRPGHVRERLLGPTFTIVTAADERWELDRRVVCPEGELPWVLIRLTVRNLTAQVAQVTLTEEWAVEPARAELLLGPAALADKPEVADIERGLWAGEVVLEVLDDVPFQRETDGTTVALGIPLELAPYGEQTVHLRFGQGRPGRVPAPDRLLETSLDELRRRLPRAEADQAPEAAYEVPWHAALLTGGACSDAVLGGSTLNQGSAYSFRHGFNGAARDALQHALPLIYTEPDLALAVLRNTCAWGSPDGDLPYALGPDKLPVALDFRPSDQNLWALWLAAEYLAATGDVAAFGLATPYHPVHKAAPVPLGENLRRQFRFLADQVGRGAHGHLRILNADWNDLVINECPAPRAEMIEHGESVLNSAMAAWVLPRYAALADRLGDAATAIEARALAQELCDVVRNEWTGRWFRRARRPGGTVVGEDDLWLEVQPWAILCGAASDEQAGRLLATIEQTAAAGSPLGARCRWPAHGDSRGMIWYAINATLIWAAVGHAPALAWDWWRRMTLTAHARAYPDVWEGTLSGPDAYLAPESVRPGRTWDLPDLGVAMQAYPIANLHSHSQPLLAYLRLLGVQPDIAGRLQVGGGARFSSPAITLRADGSGGLTARGPVTVRISTGQTISGGPGPLTWPPSAKS